MHFRSYFGDKAFYRRILLVVLPIIVQNGITQFVGLLDNVMVGQVGTEQMSGVAIANQLMFVFQLVIFGSLSGAGIFCAQYYGRGDNDTVRSVFRFKIITTILVAAAAEAVFLAFGDPLIRLFLTDTGNPESVAATLQYGHRYLNIMLVGLIPFAGVQLYSSTMRETGETTIPMRASILAVLMNMCLNYLLIFGKFGLPCLGVAGAAIATDIARFAELGFILLYAVRKRERFPFFARAWKSLYVPGRLCGEILRKGMPLLVNELIWSIGTTVLVQCYSTRGLDAVAAYNISSTVSNFFFIIAMAMGNAIAIVVGQELGAGLLDQARATARKLIMMGTVMCLAAAGIMGLTAPLFPQIYNTTAVVRQLARNLLLVDAVFLTFRGLYNSAYFTLRSGGKSFLTFLFDGGSMWIVGIPVAMLLSRLTAMPLLQLYLCVQLVDLFKAALGIFLVRKGIWVNNLTTAEEPG